MKTITLFCGRIALVDDEDYEYLSSFKWSYDQVGYAQRSVMTADGRRIRRMHHDILRVARGKLIDHIDGNGLNNQRANLRVCDRTGNNRNRIVRKDCKSGLKGVTLMASGKWRARIIVNYKAIYLGYFPNAEGAAAAYDAAAVKYFGAFARTNAQLAREQQPRAA